MFARCLDDDYPVIEMKDVHDPINGGELIWLHLRQVARLLQLDDCLNLDACSLLACLHTLW